MIRSAIVVLATVLIPDVVPPGFKQVRHELVLEADPSVTEGWQLIAAPTHGFGVASVEVGKPFRFSSKYGTKLWATKSGDTLPPSGHDAWFEGRAFASLPAEIATAPLTSPLDRVLTRCRIIGITASEIRIETIDEQLWDTRGKPFDGSWMTAALVGIALVGLSGLIVLAKTRSARQSDVP